MTFWFMDGAQVRGAAELFAGPEWRIQTTGDFDGDGKTDLMFRRDDGTLTVWQIDNGALKNGGSFQGPDSSWELLDATAYYDADGKADVVWRHDSGKLALWFMDGNIPRAGQELPLGAEWTVQEHHYDLL